MEITVSDNGEGISEKSISKIFEMFYRGTSTSVGTGLGLYITKEILNKLQGTIFVTSELGVGTIVTYIPLVSAIIAIIFLFKN
jgi:signal transduction histidine kinase